MLKISIVSDEISADPETAIEIGAQWGIRDFELRGYYFDRAPHFSAHQKLRLRESLERYQAKVIAISPGLFKFPFPTKRPAEFPLAWLDQVYYNGWSYAKKQLDEHLNELLPASLEYANELGAQTVVIFAFSRGGLKPSPPPDELLDSLLAAAERTRSAGLQLAIENEAGFWADTGERTAQIIRLINHPSLGVNWDPGNAFFEGDIPYPDGYKHLPGLVRHIHFKDAVKNALGEPEFANDGDINWVGQLMALESDGYTGFISIETHLRPKVAAAKAALDRLNNLMVAPGVI
jgi:sugar phosphate isomerase/epimerase